MPCSKLRVLLSATDAMVDFNLIPDLGLVERVMNVFWLRSSFKVDIGDCLL
jgi:hypothetical protein